MYSSAFGGITTEVAAMTVPLDDHMVHRGHSVFDTCILVNGYSSIVPTSHANLSDLTSEILMSHLFGWLCLWRWIDCWPNLCSRS
jgi:hypothetical protein